MPHVLRPCTACARHVRASESSCPFCGAKLDAFPVRNGAPLGERPTRAALLFAGMATVVGCEAHVVPAYGAPPVRDAGAEGADSGGPADAGPGNDSDSSDAADVDSDSAGD
jgi:hypothetical protein